MEKNYRTRTSWREKLEKQQEPKLVSIPPKMQKNFGRGMMLIPRPLDVDALMRRARKGKLLTVRQIRERLATLHRADTTCPLCTGIFVRIAAETAEEDRRAGRKQITPYWRVVRDDGSLNEKFPGGVQAQAKKLRQEGHHILPGKGKKAPRVSGYEHRRAAL